MMEAHESDGGVDQNDEVAVFLKSYTPEGAVGFALHLRDGYKRENADLLAKVEQLEAERSELRKKIDALQLSLNIATNPGRPNHDSELRNKVIEEAIELLATNEYFRQNLFEVNLMKTLLNSLKTKMT